jgi:hypothetical protein
MQIGRLKAKYGFTDDHFHTLTIQESGGTRRTLKRLSARSPISSPPCR